jgi:hypothetical protein
MIDTKKNIMPPHGFLYEGEFNGHHVYHKVEGLHLPTRYVLKEPWTDFVICVTFEGEDMHARYADSQGRPVLIFESDEMGYYEWCQSSSVS